MASKKNSRLPKPIWAYAYKLVPPQDESRLDAINHLLDAEHADANRGGRTWAGRVILEPRVTHILVVSDSLEQSNEINRRLEAELKELAAGFALTAPMAVEDDAVE